MNAALAERARGVPAQYITGHQEFWGMDLIVTPAVLIPRPETEHVIETVLELRTSDLELSDLSLDASRRPGPARASSETLRILDVGTGSGCIALALAKEFPDAEIHATDISAAALEIARANAARHQFEKRIHSIKRICWTGLNLAGLDFVVSNPPYVGESEEDQVQLEVRKFEPRNAVFAGPPESRSSRACFRRLTRLYAGRMAVLEISGTIAEPGKATSRWLGRDSHYPRSAGRFRASCGRESRESEV